MQAGNHTTKEGEGNMTMSMYITLLDFTSRSVTYTNLDLSYVYEVTKLQAHHSLGWGEEGKDRRAWEVILAFYMTLKGD